MNRLLLVDDNLDFLDLVEERLLLRWPGVLIFKANSGQRAIELFKKLSPFDLIISDYEMPDGDGFFLLKQLMDVNFTSRFIFLTSKDNPPLPRGFEESPQFLGVFQKMNLDELEESLDLSLEKN